MRSTRKLIRSLAVIGSVTAALLGANVAPSSAHVLTLPATTYNDGYGSFVATSYPNTAGCADYSNYTATLEFPNGDNVTVRSSANTTHENYVWGEFWDGTYDTVGPTGPAGVEENAPCPPDPINDPNGTHGNGGDTIEGFTGTLVLASGSVCELSGGKLSEGTYQRGHLGNEIIPPTEPHNFPELNIAYVFPESSGAGCPAGPLTFKTTIVHVHQGTPPFGGPYTTACNSPIAPQTCELGPQENTSEW